MTKFFQMLLLVTALSLPAFGQQVTKKAVNRSSSLETKSEDVDRYVEAKLYVGTRSQAVKALNLTEEETMGFTPIYEDYVKERKEIDMRRKALIEEYRDEMKEDDTARDEENETADFIENFWELDIDMMRLKKNMFDRFEDVMGSQRALDFFTMEDMFTARAKRSMIREAMPSMRIYVPVNVSYEQPLNNFSDWKKINIDGEVGLSHDFTYNGLEKLLTAAESMTTAEGIEVENFDTRKKEIMMKAENLKQNWKSLKHADMAREAFTMTADVLGEVARDSRFEARTPWIEKLSNTAEMIKPDVKLTDQANTVYTFFDTAEMIVNDLVKQANDMK
ncbi:hypothetical protein FUA23_16970 [Neolewinella aurantiaca]|uniref:Uncharacterized protein n=1 Tax=Neolewinella aurantiaca TaxID=2602767 RepID=A0A5C7FCJ0_9BACT|nr:hypothetical protein [Neolewinella aurantiaca]TXF87851.1 hypothetical protein FUA23_16970 [Neolewinella aurantiaca]